MLKIYRHQLPSPNFFYFRIHIFEQKLKASKHNQAYNITRISSIPHGLHHVIAKVIIHMKPPESYIKPYMSLNVHTHIKESSLLGDETINICKDISSRKFCTKDLLSLFVL